MHIVLIEEPEAHLHVQVQQVFIRKAYDVLTNHRFIKENSNFNTQLVISTHSSHIARETNFADLRYFKRLAEGPESIIATSKVINLSEVFGKNDETDKFVTRYLQATHCDLFFADAVILVEGAAENMLLPHFIRNKYPKLYQRYISILSINGRHSHRLNPLIEKLCIPTLVIADIDSAEATGHHKAICPERGKGFISSNYTITKWLIKEKDLDKLLSLPFEKKEIFKETPYKYSVRVAYQTPVSIGMFGDTMQKIYNDGKDNLAKCIPDNWVKPVKIMNHRSAKRIVTLANSIRSSVDDQKQQARSDAEEGTVRLFITSKSNNKEYVEKRVAEMMVQDTGDIGWNDEEDYKSLILEHHMAASRFGFSELYMPLSNSKKFDTSLREGSIPELSILSKLVFPLLVAYQSGNDFEVAKIIRKNSPLLNKEVFITGLNNQVELLRKAEEAVELLMKLWNDGKVPTCLEVLKSIRDTGLFKVGNRVDEVLADYSQDENEKITALRTALSAPFYELERYALYVSDNTRFATHQGVKGLEFPRVMVILDDAQARGFLFSYEKLFGVKAQSDTDEKNAHDGKDTSITRTARLFYVACTRAKKSLAIVAYTENEEMVRDTALANGWFLENEIYIV